MSSVEGVRALAVEGLTKLYRGSDGRDVTAVDGIDFEIGAGEFYTLLGPSGCGKTTTLRSVAGLERSDKGRVIVDGVVVSDGSAAYLPAHKRDIGMVFQSYAIWPHMTVFANAAFPLSVARPKVRKSLVRQQVAEALEAVGLGDFGDRMATEMSGGQQQRLALARALVRRPKLLLLDEPLSNLDAKLRDSMRTEIRRLQRQLNIATLYVTHDQTEALSMSTKIAVMSAGRIVQEGSPREIYQRPGNQFVAGFVGKTNFIEGVSSGRDTCAMLRVDSEIGAIVLDGVADAPSGTPVTLSIRPEYVLVEAAGGAHARQRSNSFLGLLESAVFYGEYLECVVRVGELAIVARLQGDGRGQRNIRPRDRVFVELPPDACVLVAAAA